MPERALGLGARLILIPILTGIAVALLLGDSCRDTLVAPSTPGSVAKEMGASPASPSGLVTREASETHPQDV